MERIPLTGDNSLRGHRSSRPGAALAVVLGVGLLAILSAAGPVSAAGAEPDAARYREGFETAAPSWRVSAETTDTALLRLHDRTRTQTHSGQFAERIQIDAIRRGERMFVEHSVPAALVFDELAAAVWVHCNRPGIKFGVRIVFPEQIDPRTSKPLTADLLGSEYSTPRRWQQLTCRADDAQVRRLLGRLRAQLARQLTTPDLNTQGMYVDRAVLSLEVEPGGYELVIDDLEVGPVIEPASNGAAVIQAPGDQPLRAPVTLGDGRLLREGRPFFPVVTPYHGEDPALLRQLGFNVVWIPRFDDQKLLDALAAEGLGAMAEPPAERVRPAERSIVDGTYDVGIPSFTPATANILFWSLGCEVSPAALSSVRAAADAVRDADPYRRPIFADVAGQAREFHRALDILGVSRHSIHTSTSPLEYAAFLERAQLQALRGKPTFTWVFVEPNSANLANRPREAAPPVIEYEQLMLQVYAALGAGHKAIGLWKHSRLDDATPAGNERRQAVLLANLQIHLLRRWIAAGKVVDLAPVRLGEGRSPVPRGFQQTLFTNYNRLASDTRPLDALAAQVRAPVLRSDAGWLVLPQWLEADAQFQPDAMSAQDVRILLRGEECPHAWLVTPTGVHPYQLVCDTEASGGTEIRLQRFEQCAAIVLTQDLSVIEELRRETQRTRELAGPAFVQLAQARLDRVQEVHDELQKLAAKSVKDADFLLAQARRDLRSAEDELSAGNFDGARLASERVLKLTRLVMRGHWENAARLFSSPVATPYTVSFQTLPDFWKLMHAVGRGRPSPDNLLPGGKFEAWDNILYPGGWERSLAGRDLEQTVLELAPDGMAGRCLRIAALPADPQNPPSLVSEPPVRLTSPPIPVYSGQIVHVRGHVRIETPVTGGNDGLMIYDNLSGTVGALRWGVDAPRGRWLPFELLRPVQRSGDFHLTIELCGLGDVKIDELQVKTLSLDE